MRVVAKAIASVGFLTYLPARLFKGRTMTGAGLIGSLAGLLTLRWLPEDPLRQALVWLGLLAVAVAVSDVCEESMGTHDDPRIVIDEWIGYWTAMLFLPRSAGFLLAAFVLFRVFDVYKWGWIGRAATLPGGWGIVIDDVLAGVATNLLLQMAHFVGLK